MMMGLMGSSPRLDALGGDLSTICVVETNGAIGILDVLRICGGEYSRDELNVFDSSLDGHISHFKIEEIQKPCGKCTSCPYFSSCGGGYLPHRFDGETFDNPSLYCDALYGLSERMMTELRAELPKSVWKNPVTLADALTNA